MLFAFVTFEENINITLLESSLTSLDRERWIGRTLTGVCVPLAASRSRSRMKETVECVSGSTRQATSRVLRLIPLWSTQSDASQEAERLTDDWTVRSADVPNLSYSQFVLFYSFIALANCVAAYPPTRGKAKERSSFSLSYPARSRESAV